MNTLHVFLLLGLVVVATATVWSPDYREHDQCLDNCFPDACPSGCRGGCLCYRRFDYPNHGYCLNPSKRIPKSFRNLGKSQG
uniref:Putative secreted protein n=1 Tax=Amblyomma triste TaxID=251400 RepID=A0A023GBR6_AMBTT